MLAIPSTTTQASRAGWRLRKASSSALATTVLATSAQVTRTGKKALSATSVETARSSGPGSARGEFSYPYDVRVDEQGRQYVCEFGNSRETELDADDQVLAVIGENGAGKSTLVKIQAGVLPPDEGEILLDGKPVEIQDVSAALERGIALMHQELNLAENLDVAANVYLGREPRRAAAGGHGRGRGRRDR